MPTASPYLKTALTRWTDRQTAVRRDVESLLDQTAEKRAYLDDLMKQILRHRQDDAQQMLQFREEAASRWQERLKRLEGWMENAGSMTPRFGRVQGWHDNAKWFDHAGRLAERATQRFEKRVLQYEDLRLSWQADIAHWIGQLGLKDAELHEFKSRQAASDHEIFVSAARKKPFLDFVVEQRDHETHLGKTYRTLRESAIQTLQRLDDILQQSQSRANDDPARFEMSRRHIDAIVEPLRRRYEALRTQVMNDALLMEEGRKRLRDVYEVVQQMRVIETGPAQRRTFLDRLLKYEKE